MLFYDKDDNLIFSGGTLTSKTKEMNIKVKLKLAEVFGDHMVLQRGKPVKIWGKAVSGALVEVEIQGKQVQTTVKSDGTWQAQLSELEASECETMKVTCGEEELTLNDVAVGEVWLAGGQSNMEFFMRYDRDLKEVVKTCENPKIRFYDYPEISTERQRQTKTYLDFGFWRVCDSENLQYYSAVGYYFAKYLQEALDVPVGIVGCNWGGTRACCWMDEASVMRYGAIWQEEYETGLANIRDLKAAEAAYENNPICDRTRAFSDPFMDRMLYGLSREELEMFSMKMNDPSGADFEFFNQIGPWSEWRPSGLYHTMLEHVSPYTVRGVLWYQGESDDIHADLYESMLTGLIRCWRSLWGEELPFIIVQLAPYGEMMPPGGKFYPILRCAQENVSKSEPSVYMAVTGDVGHDFDIHPKEKQPVGRRMALLARGHVYGEDILCEAPAVADVVRTGSEIKITFDHADGGLTLKGDTVNALAIRVDGAQAQIPADHYSARIEGTQMIIRFDEDVLKDESTMKGDDVQTDDAAVVVEFARTPYFEVNVYNASDIPVRPFEVKVN